MTGFAEKIICPVFRVSVLAGVFQIACIILVIWSVGGGERDLLAEAVRNLDEGDFNDLLALYAV